MLRRSGPRDDPFGSDAERILGGGEMMSKSATGGVAVVGGVAFHNVAMPEAVARILLMVQKADRPCHICTGNLDHLALLRSDPQFRSIYADASLVLADGMPVVWLSRLAAARGRGPAIRERVAGSDLLWELSRASARCGLRLFFLGGPPGVAELAAKEVARRYPGVEICGIYSPPFETFSTLEEQDRIRQRIRDAAPDVLLVGFGAPKQEKWIAANKNVLHVPVCIGVGGSFEMAAGVLRRAPRWAQRIGLEWAFRMVQDPRRLGPRYLGRDLPFLLKLLREELRRSNVSESEPDRGGNRPAGTTPLPRQYALAGGGTVSTACGSGTNGGGGAELHHLPSGTEDGGDGE